MTPSKLRKLAKQLEQKFTKPSKLREHAKQLEHSVCSFQAQAPPVAGQRICNRVCFCLEAPGGSAPLGHPMLASFLLKAFFGVKVSIGGDGPETPKPRRLSKEGVVPKGASDE